MASPGDQPAESKVEQAKKASNYLRGTIQEVLASDAPKFEHDDSQLLKFHGAYQQYDRDARKTAGQGRAERVHQFMVRCKIPGGLLTAEQYLALDAITDDLASGTLRVTSRQGLQYHGVLKKNLSGTIARINQALVTTLGACGDVERNVMACPAPTGDGVQEKVAQFCGRIAAELTPASRAYHELWLDGEKIQSTQEQEPFYSSQYLPRKFKTALAMPGDNCVDLYTHDVGLLSVVADGEVRGANVLVGGGMGLTHHKPDTFARLASPLGYVEADRLIEAVRAIAAIFRDHGNRADRRHARLKYLIEQWGMERFTEEFRGRVGFELQPWVEDGPLEAHDHLGRHQAGADTWYYGVLVENGRVQDLPQRRMRSALRKVVQELSPGVRFTPQQNVLFTDLSEGDVERLERILDDHGVPLADQASQVRRLSLACPAFPTCGLAITESERVMPSILDQFEAELAALGLAGEPISIRTTGCPNGCTRPYTADISFVGRAKDSYNVYVGGRLAGDRLTDLFAEKVPLAALLETVHPLLVEWRDQRNPGEGFGDYYQRTHHHGPPLHILTGAKLADGLRAEAKPSAPPATG
ncbi:MAG: NADPH-dependent assimilatory sulfite reductase hemoprotein subunit [Planctomycetota bacterium]|jgi:sulfite reductase beta subunit-like hemoprotein